MLNPIFYINGNWQEKSDAKISVNDAGFLLGDGLFETIRFQNRKLFLLDKHLARLKAGLKTIKIKSEYSDFELFNILKEIIKKNNLEKS